MIRELANENKRKAEQKQRDETRIHSPSYLLLRKTKRRPRKRNHGSKNIPPLGGRSGIASTRAPEELGTRATEELGTRATEELNTGATEEIGVGASEELVPDVQLLQKDQD